eukprot:m51a1_g21 hypothetical protein (727) ;mRNA; r:92099-95163
MAETNEGWFASALQCKICAEPFDLQRHDPRVLDCLHTFCGECLARLEAQARAAGDTGVRCPLDRSLTPLPQAVRPSGSFRKNFVLIELLLECAECRQYLCAACLEMHDALHDHQTEPCCCAPEDPGADPGDGGLGAGADITHENVRLAREQEYGECAKHPRNAVQMYCTQCRVAVCALCALFDHKAHETVLLSDAAQSARASLRESNVDVSRVLEAASTALVDASAGAERARTAFKAYRDLVDSEFALLAAHVHEKRRLAIADIDETFVTSMRDADAAIAALRQRIGELEVVHTFVEDLSRTSSDTELCSWFDKASKRIQAVVAGGVRMIMLPRFPEEDLVKESFEAVMDGLESLAVPGVGVVDLLPAPSPVPRDRTPLPSAGASYDHTFGPSGVLLACGYNGNGEVGNSGEERELSLVPVVFAGRNVRALATGGHHSIAVLDTAEVLVWGQNSNGELGLGDTAERRSPQAVSYLSLRNGVRMVSCGSSHSVAVLDSNEVFVWGYNYNGELGLGDTLSRKTPQPLRVFTPSSPRIQLMVSGANHNIALIDSGELVVWGFNRYGQLGVGTTVNQTEPLPVSFFCKTDSSAQTIACGAHHSAVVTTSGDLFVFGWNAHFTGQVLAWGANDYGQLGLGDTRLRPTPEIVSGIAPEAQRVLSVHARGNFTVARGVDELFVWGEGDHGELGDGLGKHHTSPTRLSVPGVCSVSCGFNHTVLGTTTASTDAH